MALPVDGLLSSQAIKATFTPPRDRLRLPLEDWSRGGQGLNDATRGLNLYDWHAYLDGTDLYLGSPGAVPDTLVYSIGEPVTEIAASFDTNMQPVIGWTTEAGAAWFRWFDPTIPAFTNVALAAGSRSVRICIDDVRDSQFTIRDTVIAYLRGEALYYRQLRDRFEVEYLLHSGLRDYALTQIGMNNLLRFQFELTPQVACEEPGRATRAYVSAYDRTRVHQVTLYRFEKRCMVANFHGALPPERSIVTATWYADGPQIGALSSPRIDSDRREVLVQFASQFMGRTTLKCEVELDNGEVYTHVFRVQVRNAARFQNDVPSIRGPSKVTVRA